MEIPFDKKMQVFFPYLKYALEVKQVVRLFKGMYYFIYVF